MNWPTDALAGFYLFLFVFGLIFSVVTLFLGAAHGHLPLPDGHDFGHAGEAPHGAHAGQAAPHPGDHAPAHGDAPSPLNLSTILIFLTWFGAAGYILRAYYGSLAGVSFLIALVCGLVGATVVYLFLAKFLWRGQTALDPANYALVGTLARVSSPIRANGTGEIVYTLDGKQRVDGARSAEGVALPLGAEVVITRYEGGLAYVEPWETWAGQEALTQEPFLGEPIEPPTPGSRSP